MTNTPSVLLQLAKVFAKLGCLKLIIPLEFSNLIRMRERPVGTRRVVEVIEQQTGDEDQTENSSQRSAVIQSVFQMEGRFDGE